MSSSLIIQLHHLRFVGEHGMYEEERKVGNEFEVNVSLEVKAPKEKLTSLDGTINYAEVHRIVKEVFSERKLLLETLVMEMAGQLKLNFPSIKKISIQIMKLNPPITSFVGSVSVTYEKTYK